jgi:2-polyprenyl-6-hydroxyphenyl methylase/3-demethylubiquinone-9 3-methyltransferase
MFNQNWGQMNPLFKIDYSILSEEERLAIDGFLRKLPNPPTQKDMWMLLDEVWDYLGCDNENLDFDKISAFYKHPIWLFNGIYIEQDDISLAHRMAITDWVIYNRNRIDSILDYGGGFGTLDRLIAKRDLKLNIDIFEPHPSNMAIIKAREFPNIRFINSIELKYDCLISTDVIEHCHEPLNIFYEMIQSVKIDGHLLIANNFSPCIKCHLPSTFHLRYTFNLFAQLMGLNFIGMCHGSHAKIFQKTSEINIRHKTLQQLEKLSKILFPVFNVTHISLRKVKHLLK